MGAPSVEVDASVDVSLKVKAPSCEVKVKCPSCEVKVKCPSCEVKVKGPSCEVKAPSVELEVSGGGGWCCGGSADVEIEMEVEAFPGELALLRAQGKVKAPSVEMSVEVDASVEVK